MQLPCRKLKGQISTRKTVRPSATPRITSLSNTTRKNTKFRGKSGHSSIPQYHRPWQREQSKEGWKTYTVCHCSPHRSGWRGLSKFSAVTRILLPSRSSTHSSNTSERVSSPMWAWWLRTACSVSGLASVPKSALPPLQIRQPASAQPRPEPKSTRSPAFHISCIVFQNSEFRKRPKHRNQKKHLSIKSRNYLLPSSSAAINFTFHQYYIQRYVQE